MQYFIEIFTPTKFHEILHHYSRTDLSPIPARLAEKSYITSWCIQNGRQKTFGLHYANFLDMTVGLSTETAKGHAEIFFSGADKIFFVETR